jgi:hypothetical protein
MVGEMIGTTRGGRAMWKRGIVVLGFALAGCATEPVAWVRADGKVSDPEQRQLAETICQGEEDKTRLIETGNVGVFPTMAAHDRVYAGAMAEHGYVGLSMR